MSNESPNKAQNSPIREFFSNTTDRIAQGLVNTFPSITADMVTYAGLAGVVAGSAVKIFPENLIPYNTSSFASLGLITSALLCDALDGAVARNTKKPPNKSEFSGALTDLTQDRIGESIMALSRIVTAASRGDSLGVVTATVSGLTAPLPSLLRAMVEKNGFFVPEAGGNPFSFLGTRMTRAGLSIPATTVPETKIFGQNLQPVFDALSAFGNISATIERAQIYRLARKNELNINYDKKAQKLGKLKVDRLTKFALINTATLLAAGIIGLTCTMKK